MSDHRKGAAKGRVLKKFMPGQLGTKRWKDQYGEALLCVRYREDTDAQRRYTTVELVVDERGMPVRHAKAEDAA